jgi:hypothetical protein
LFKLLSPSALLALGALVVPLAIYLWNRRPGRTVQVGSLRWLEAGANRRLRRLSPEQLLLFLLRAAMLALLALALAGPVWQRPARPQRGPVLISPELLTSRGVEAVRPQIDSLRRQGHSLRLLQRGFPLVPAAAWLRPDSAYPASPKPQPVDNLWARLQQATDSFPQGRLWAFTSARLRNFQGARPALSRRLVWTALPLDDSTTWVQAAFRPLATTLTLLLGHSAEDRTTFRTITRPVSSQPIAVPGLGNWQYQASADRTLLVSPTDTLPVQTDAWRVWVREAPAYAEEVRHVRAALRVAALGVAMPLQLVVSAEAPPAAQPLDWVFWLTDAPLPAQLKTRMATGLNVWQVATGPGKAVATHFAPFPEGPVVSVQRRGEAVAMSRALTLWADATGLPLLTYIPAQKGGHYQLHTRFQAGWSELGETAELPALLLPVLYPKPALHAAHDFRTLPPSLLQRFEDTAPATQTIAKSPVELDLRVWWILAAGILWAIELLVASRHSRVSAVNTSAV